MKMRMYEKMTKPEDLMREERTQLVSPSDDCCPICFGAFKVPCKTSCGHWFCANCILTFWNYKDALQRCKCPICTRLIDNLALGELVAVHKAEEEVVEVLQKVQKYNRLFAGGAFGLLMKVHQLPQYSRRFLIGLFDPCNIKKNYVAARIIALLLTSLYGISGFGDHWGPKIDFDYMARACIGGAAILGIVFSIIRRIFMRP